MKSFLLFLLLAVVFSVHGTDILYRNKGEMHFSGQKNRLRIPQEKALPWDKGMTFSVIFQTGKGTDLSAPDRRLDAYFFRAGEFVIARRGRRIGVCFRVNGKWDKWYESKPVKTLENFEKHHLAVTLNRHYLIDQGEDWIELGLFLDGEKIGEHKVYSGIQTGAKMLEIGSADAFGLPWRFAGILTDITVYSRILPDGEIRRLAASIPGGESRRNILPQLTEEQKQLISRSGGAPEIRSALSAAALRGLELKKLQDLIRHPERYLTVFRGEESALILSRHPDVPGLLSWFDGKNNKELLAPNSKIFFLQVRRGNSDLSLDSNARNCRIRTEAVSGGMILHYDWKLNSGNITARLRIGFEKDRLSMNLATENKSPFQLVKTVFPALRFQADDLKNTRVLTPEGCGVVRPWELAVKKAYTGIYPRGTCAMPLSAFYNTRGGVLAALMDPYAMSKEMRVSCDRSMWECHFDKRGLHKIGGRRKDPKQSSQNQQRQSSQDRCRQ